MQSAISKSLKKHLDENYSLLISLRLTDETCIFYFEINFLKVSCLHGLNWGSDGDLPLEVSLPCGLSRAASGSALPWTHDTPVSQGPPGESAQPNREDSCPRLMTAETVASPPGLCCLQPSLAMRLRMCVHTSHTHTHAHARSCVHGDVHGELIAALRQHGVLRRWSRSPRVLTEPRSACPRRLRLQPTPVRDSQGHARTECLSEFKSWA